MISQNLQHKLKTLSGSKSLKFTEIKSSESSIVMIVSSETEKMVLKCYSGNKASALSECEYEGLLTLKNNNAVKVPEVYHYDFVDNIPFLLMEYIDSKTPEGKDHIRLAEHVASLHNIKVGRFGYDRNNFIATLDQENDWESNWPEFFVNHRLVPQIELSIKKNYLLRKAVPEKNKILHYCKSIMNAVDASLLHGDLWSGNYLISKDGTPYLIDPAVYYGHNEVDIAMTLLFGGFGPSFYDAYFSLCPQGEQMPERIEMYQLYYLLVHLNLFGISYKGAVEKNLSKITT